MRGISLVAVLGCAAVLCVAACSRGDGEGTLSKPSEKVVRQARGAGRWFPGGRAELDQMVRGFIDNASAPAVTGRIVAAIAPHAGYIYSGKVAGHTFRALREKAGAGHAPETVVVLGFSHSGGFRGVALMDGDAIETPLGETPLDKEAAAALAQASPLIRMAYAPHAGEHSAENQIPFAQAALPDAKLVVGLIGDHEEPTLSALVTALGQLAKRKKIVVVASTDLLHDADYTLVTKTDRKTMEQIGALDWKGLLGRWGYGSQVCCGIGPVVAALRFAESQGCRQGAVLYYRNSGDDYPESRGNWVVGYGSAVFAVGP
jgi:hypothetical protein